MKLVTKLSNNMQRSQNVTKVKVCIKLETVVKLNTIYLFILGFMSLSTHCIGHIMTGILMGRGNQYIQLVKVLHCKLLTNGKQLPAFPLEVRPGFELGSQRWEARVLHSATVAPRHSLTHNKNHKFEKKCHSGVFSTH